VTARLLALLAGITVVVAASVTVGLQQLQDHRERFSAPPTVAVAGQDGVAGPQRGLGTGDRIVFRHTGTDTEYGHLAAVPLADPAGPRSFADRTCDRVDATASTISCLVTQPGVPTTFEALVLDRTGAEERRMSLAGIPSRTRLSPSGRLLATTVFVSGHSYMQSGFSTSTVIRRTDGTGATIDLEDLDLVVDGQVRTPRDRNFWGVTFRDDRTFWATVSTGGRTWLLQGDLDAGRLTALAGNAECPSVSPDGSRVAYKVRVGDGATPVWELEVRDLRSGHTVRLPATRGLDDQAEWLDEDTLLYGLARADEPGITDVWAVDVRPTASPSLLIEQAWSPTVIQEDKP
jgi:hypothetical protein